MKRWEEMGYGEAELAQIRHQLLNDHQVITQMRGGLGSRKVKFVLNKEGDTPQTLYVDVMHEAFENIYLLLLLRK